MTEAAFWQHIRPRLAPYGLLERIENNIGTKGTADVNYCLLGVEGWIELKYARDWPTRIGTRFRFSHLTLDQVLWHEHRARHKSRTCMLAQVGRDYFILAVPAMRAVVERGATREEYKGLAAVWGATVFPVVPVVKYLTGR